MEVENWRAVVGYEGLYEVSDLGRVRSLDTVKYCGPGRTGRTLPGRILSMKTDRKGYFVLNLCSTHDDNGARVKKSHLVHRLVAKAFLGVPPDGHNDVNHKDFITTNNRVSNLEWTTRNGNLMHSSRAGRLHGNLGWSTRLPGCESTVLGLFSLGLRGRQVAFLTGGTMSAVYSVRSRAARII